MQSKTNPKKSLNELFKLIRYEQVCLWVGAGFSLYAGYPSANGLKEKIQQELDGIHLNAGKELIDIAEAFVIKRGRKELQDLIVKIFSVEPQDTTLWFFARFTISYIFSLPSSSLGKLGAATFYFRGQHPPECQSNLASEGTFTTQSISV